MKLIIYIVFFLVFTACSSVKPYQKMYLNDSDMSLSTNKMKQYEVNSQNYREGVSGANGGKAGGGCGCN